MPPSQLQPSRRPLVVMGVSGTGHYMPVALIVANVGARLLHRPQDATAKVSA